MDRLRLRGFVPVIVLVAMSTPALAQEPTPGDRLYREHCIGCHGEGGRSLQPNPGAARPASRVIPSLNTGAIEAALTTDVFKGVLDRATVTRTILDGSAVEGTLSTVSMPAYRGKLTPAEIETLLGHLEQLCAARPARYTTGRTLFLALLWFGLGAAGFVLFAGGRLSRTKEEEGVFVPVDNLDRIRLMELDACTRCGECVAWCPVYTVNEDLGNTALTRCAEFRCLIADQHGLAARWLGPGRFGPDEAGPLAQRLYACSTCGQCREVCPAGIDTVELWEGLRHSMVRAGCGPLENQVPLIKSVKAYNNPWGQPRSAREKWAKKAAREGLIAKAPDRIRKRPAKVLYFVGCTAAYDMNIREVAINTVRVLERCGVDFGVLGNEEACCASVLLRMGEPDFYRIAKENIDLFNGLGIHTLVTSCSGCFKTIKQDYPRVAPLDFEVLHMTELMERMRSEGRLAFVRSVEATVTYHDPCHLGRANRLFDAPREILRAIPGVTLVEMERVREFSRCCGAGGGLKAGFPEIQAETSKLRVADAEATGASELVTACPFCYQALKGAIVQKEAPIRMRDVTELVVESMAGDA